MQPDTSVAYNFRKIQGGILNFSPSSTPYVHLGKYDKLQASYLRMYRMLYSSLIVLYEVNLYKQIYIYSVI